MPFTHHSHSGQFCPSHARNSLAEVLQAANDKAMSVMAFTEHIPRGKADQYPSEIRDGHGPVEQRSIYDSFVVEARRLQQLQEQKRAQGESACTILIGMEGEWIRPAESTAIVRDLMQCHNLDFMVGSVHHVHTIPIDYDHETYIQARHVSGGSDVELFLAYFDAQYEMLQALQPLVVGHFDLIRLYSNAPDEDLRRKGNSSEVWQRICRNLQVVKAYNGVLEVNSSAVRKGLEQPYPRQEICEEWLRMGGGLVMSDDSHGTDQVGACYMQVRDFLRRLGLEHLAYLEKGRSGGVAIRNMPWKEVEDHPFWNKIA